MPMPDGELGHAELRIGALHIPLADEDTEQGVRSPQHYGGTPVNILIMSKRRWRVPAGDRQWSQGNATAPRYVLWRSNQLGDRSIRAFLVHPHSHQGCFAGGDAERGAAIAALQPSDTGQACMMLCMRQLNLNVTPEFERDLRRLMRQRGISNKSDAIRGAVADAAARHAANMNCDFRSWLGLGLKAPLNPKPRFHGEDDLWS